MLKVAREIERQKLDEEIKTCRPTNSHRYTTCICSNSSSQRPSYEGPTDNLHVLEMM